MSDDIFDEWFRRIAQFNKRMPGCATTDEDQTDNAIISAEFDSLLLSMGISTRTFKCEGFLGINYAWCSDWDAYECDPTSPVLYIDSHYDVVWKDMIAPFRRQGTDVVVASCHDNRASCNVVCRAIEDGILSSRKDCTIYVLFSDGEERGMMCVRDWYSRARIPHQKERYLVMDATDCPAVGNFLGRGVYAFDGDPVEKYVDSDVDGIIQQHATHREPYPGGLCYTHAGVLYSKFDCVVSRIGIPVGVSLHGSHTEVSLADLNGYYRKLCKIVKSIEF